jgi:hypothetical protein
MKGIKDMERERIEAENRKLKAKKIPKQKILIELKFFIFMLSEKELEKMFDSKFPFNILELMGVKPYGIEYKEMTLNLN